jgi:hypothetical protein
MEGGDPKKTKPNQIAKQCEKQNHGGKVTVQRKESQTQANTLRGKKIHHYP